jgi:hypothetical protein
MMNMVHALMHTVQRLTMLNGGSAFGFCPSWQITCASCTNMWPRISCGAAIHELHGLLVWTDRGAR